MSRLRRLSRWQAAALHLGASAAIALIAVGAMLFVWYPRPWFEAMGGAQLLLILVGVDVVIGPLLTLIVFHPAKKELRFDLSVIATLQLAALAYGGWVLFEGRPAYAIFVQDRFVLMRASEYQPATLERAVYPEFRSLPVTGPRVIAARTATTDDERNTLVLSAAIAGIDVQHLPEYYVPYAERQAAVAGAARPLAELRTIDPANGAAIDRFLARAGAPERTFAFLPAVGKSRDLAAIVHAADGAFVALIAAVPWR